MIPQFQSSVCFNKSWHQSRSCWSPSFSLVLPPTQPTKLIQIRNNWSWHPQGLAKSSWRERRRCLHHRHQCSCWPPTLPPPSECKPASVLSSHPQPQTVTTHNCLHNLLWNMLISEQVTSFPKSISTWISILDASANIALSTVYDDTIKKLQHAGAVWWKIRIFIFINKSGNVHINVIRCIHVTTVAKQNYIFIT